MLSECVVIQDGESSCEATSVSVKKPHQGTNMLDKTSLHIGGRPKSEIITYRPMIDPILRYL